MTKKEHHFKYFLALHHFLWPRSLPFRGSALFCLCTDGHWGLLHLALVNTVSVSPRVQVLVSILWGGGHRFVLSAVVWDRVLPCSPGWPETRHVTSTGLYIGRERLLAPLASNDFLFFPKAALKSENGGLRFKSRPKQTGGQTGSEGVLVDMRGPGWEETVRTAKWFFFSQKDEKIIVNI